MRQLGEDLEVDTILPCDVTRPEEMDKLVEGVADRFGKLDCLFHGIAFAKREELTGTYLETSREGYHLAQEVSAYSLPAVARRAIPLMEGSEGSIITLTYMGSVRVIPNYNVMGLAKASLESCMRFLAADLGAKGIRVNAISAGAVKTLAAAGIGGFRKMQTYAVKAAPLRRTVTIEEIGNTAAFLCSDLASGITGETTFVDAGVNIMGMVFDEDEEQ